MHPRGAPGQPADDALRDMLIYVRGSFLIRRQSGLPGFVLPLVISNSANNEEGNAIRVEPNQNRAQLEMSPIGNEPCVVELCDKFGAHAAKLDHLELLWFDWLWLATTRY